MTYWKFIDENIENFDNIRAFIFASLSIKDSTLFKSVPNGLSNVLVVESVFEFSSNFMFSRTSKVEFETCLPATICA